MADSIFSCDDDLRTAKDIIVYNSVLCLYEATETFTYHIYNHTWGIHCLFMYSFLIVLGSPFPPATPPRALRNPTIFAHHGFAWHLSIGCCRCCCCRFVVGVAVEQQRFFFFIQYITNMISRSLFLSLLLWVFAARAEDADNDGGNDNGNNNYNNYDAQQYTEGQDASDYIEYWTEYAIFPKKCIV